ncbi:MarR family winged helix-turn-helix transcriptional regulator [Seleniivibrio woodruffii]|uniref:MarR family winged helix-turn-helix transcriptional regulator n=1 Tax=Seleniivibrio woodruffii TaxID=1078050 RepID=UPI002409879E|nr:MarR family transcriptional regulator [Seleniivibrio woodruffii]
MTKHKGTAEEVEALDVYIKLMRASKSVTDAAHDHLTKEKLSDTQFGVLETLYHLGALCQKELADKNLKSTANITTVIDNLEKRKLVERVRSEEDRRYITVHLTEEGHNLIHRIFPDHARAIVKCFRPLTAEEKKTLGDICRKLGKSQTA